MSHIAMLAHSYYPLNPRTRLQAVSVARAGHEVEMFCPRAPGEPAEETCDGVRVHRLPVRRDRSRGIGGYLLEYARFFLLARAALARREREEHFDLVVAHNIPEQLVYAAGPAKRQGAAVVLDVHDPLPELFGEKFSRPESARLIARLKRLELAACRFADHVFVATDPLKDRLADMGYPPERITPILNSPQFRPPEAGAPKPFVIVYHGTIAERYALDNVLAALSLAIEDAPELELHVFGSDVDDDHLDRLKRMVQDLELGGHVAFNGYVAPMALRQVLATADLGLVSMRRPSHIDLAYPMKLFEYLAHGVPVLSVATEPLTRLFDNGEVDFYEESNPADLARSLVAAVRRRNALHTPARTPEPRPGRLAPELSWPEQERRYLAVVEQLTTAAAG